MKELMRKALRECCPVCDKGKVFASRGNVFLLKAPCMHPECPVCGHRFEREPGYFTGAMYVSYGLAVAEVLTVFIVWLLLGLPLDYALYFLYPTVFLLWAFNFRKARMIWMLMDVELTGKARPGE